MNDYIEIIFEVPSASENDMLIAWLTDIGFEAFEEEESLLKAFITEQDFDETQLKQVARKINLPYIKSPVKARNWNTLWEESFEPVVIDNFCVIRAAFHLPVSGIQHEIIITPKMSFGTGHHATTYMMIEAMKEVAFTGKTVLDFGTGTGVLAILAEKMGSSVVDAIDNDEWSINNAKENIQTNNCRNIHIRNAGALPGSEHYHIILANINKHIILQHMPAMRKAILPDGIILLSGMLHTDLNDVRTALKVYGMHLSGVQEKNTWICIQCKPDTN